MLSLEMAGIVGNDCLDKIEAALDQDLLLLFDGLDTGFGNTERDRKRRSEALEGLFEGVLERSNNSKLRFKVVLREDIWRTLKFQNKSHFYGRYVTRDWRDQAN